MRSYFFVPATKLHHLETVRESGVTDIIIDYEDSLLVEQREFYLDELKRVTHPGQYHYRVPLRNEFSEEPDFDFIRKFLSVGADKFILPKLIGNMEVKQVLEFFKNKDVKLVLLVEHPRLLMELNEILNLNETYGLIRGIAIGTHDLATVMGFEHSMVNLEFPRNLVIYHAKAFDLEAIDFASMNIHDKERFDSELLSGMQKGFDAKLLIHPRQFEWMRTNEQFVQGQITWAETVINSLPAEHRDKEINPYILNGEIIEKAHIEKALNILKKAKDGK